MRNNYLIFMSACLYTFRAPHSSTVSLSWTTLMRKLGVWSSSLKITPFASVLAPVLKKQTEGHSVSLVNLQSPSACRRHQWTSTYFSFADNKWKSISLSPMVVSQNFSSATSLAMLAPIRTLTSIASFSRMMSEMSFSPSGPSSIPWMTTIRRRGMYLVPSGLEVMDSLCSTTKRPVMPWLQNNMKLCDLTEHFPTSPGEQRSYFDEWYPDGSLRDVSSHLVTDAADELMRDHKHQDLCSFDGLCDIWNSHLMRCRQQS